MFASSSGGLPPGAGARVEIPTGDPFTTAFQVSGCGLLDPGVGEFVLRKDCLISRTDSEFHW
jgi:hypothetical protein